MLEAEEQRHAQQRLSQEAAWQQELRRLEHDREEKYAQYAHVADLARLEITRVESIGAMSDTAKVALAATPNAAALADFMKTQIHAGMSPQQLAALSGVVAATNSVTAAEAARQAQERVDHERSHRDAELDKDRRHQLDLLGVQNDVNKTALTAQSALGIGVAQASAPAPVRLCPNGHRAAPTDKFCAQCGAAIAT